MSQKQITEDDRMEIAMKVTDELKKGGITREAIEGFKKLIGQEALEKLASESHFGNTLLPDDDW